jgi:hypothetical protein
MQFPPGRAKLLDRLLPRPPDHCIDICDRVGVARADHADKALA